MNIKSAITGSLSNLFRREQENPLDRYMMQYLQQNAIYPNANNDFYLSSYCESADPFVVINKITEPAATVPIYEYDSKGEIVENGKMISLLNKPNPYQGGSEFIEAALSFYYIFGEAFCATETLGETINNPVRLDALPPQLMQIIMSNLVFNPIKGYSFYPGGRGSSSVDYVKEKVFHWKEFNPAFDLLGGHLRGMSRLRPIIKTITGSTEGYNSLVKAFQAQGMWGILSLLDKDNQAINLSKEQKSELKNKYKLDSKRGDITISNWKAEYTKMGLTVVELDIIRSVGVLFGKTADAFNVPSQLFSGSQDRTYNNYKEAEQALWRNAIQPSLNALLKGLTELLAPAFGVQGNTLKADYSEVACLQTNKSEMITWMTAARSFTKNEIREAVGYERLTLPGMDEVFDAAGLMPVSMLGEMPDQAVTEEVLKALHISDYRTKYASKN